MSAPFPSRIAARLRGAFVFGAVGAAGLICACAITRADPSTTPSPSVSAAASVTSSDGFQISVTTAEPINGQIVLVNVKGPEESLKAKVSGEFEGISLPFYDVSASEKEAVLGIPYERKPGPATIHVSIGEGPEAHKIDAPVTIREGHYPFESITVAERFARPKPRALKRALREAKEVSAIYRHITEHKYWQGPFRFPVKEVVFRSVYGTARVYNNGARRRAHFGLDFKASIGTPIYAPAPGKVVLAKNLYFTGNTVILDHGYGLITLYAHMSKIKVRKGAEVEPGQLLGLAGMTGQVTGPHLHWQCMVQSQKVNPLDLTKIMR